MRIVSQRFLLRDFIPSDKEAFVHFQTDPGLLLRLGAEDSVPGHASALFERFMLWSSETPRHRYQLGIYRVDNPSLLMGCCGIRGTYENRDNAEMGISLAPQYWGRYAFAAEIVDMLLEFGFSSLSLVKIHGSTASRNNQVARLAKWFGAVQSDSAAANAEHELPQTGWEISRERWESIKGQRRMWARDIQIDWS